jgi:glycosyltransferase involved in cell wall biosynthesis
MLGGIYSVVLSMRRALAEQGVDLTWVAAGRTMSRDVLETATKEDMVFGAVIATDTDDEVEKAKALLEYIAQSGAQIVVFHALGGLMETNLARYLPGHVRRILIVHTITVSTYNAAKAVRDWVHAAIGVSPRISFDLVNRCGWEAARVFTIPNAVDVTVFQGSARSRAADRPLRVLSCGRVEHASKGALWIPSIVQRAIKLGADVTVTIGGDGPDLAQLRDEVVRRGIEGRVRFLGAVPRASVPDLMAEHDVLLFLSIYEGLGITLVEAMATGCVPVASCIRGVTDFLIRDGDNGLLFAIGDTDAAAAHLLYLYRNAEARAAMGRSAAGSAGRFDLPRFGEAYAKVLEHVLKSHHPINVPLAMTDWRMPGLLGPGLRRFVPAGMKNSLRIVRERLHGLGSNTSA